MKIFFHKVVFICVLVIGFKKLARASIGACLAVLLFQVNINGYRFFTILT